MSQEIKPFIVEGYEITPLSIVLALLDGDLTDTEAAEWIEKLYAHRRAQPAVEAEHSIPPIFYNGETKRNPEFKARVEKWTDEQNRKLAAAIDRTFAAPPAAANQAGITGKSISDDMMDLVDRLGSQYDEVDPRAWRHLLIYAPKPEMTRRFLREDKQCTQTPSVSRDHIVALAKLCKLLGNYTTAEYVDAVVGFARVLLNDNGVQEAFVSANAGLLAAAPESHALGGGDDMKP